jgi:rhodanese-related sulfurtransferase
MFGRSPAVTASEAVALVHDGAVLADVREPSEFSAGHAAGALSMPLGQLGQRDPRLTSAACVLVICASGARSRLATRQLIKAGVPATNVTGGLPAWARAGGSVVRGS